MTLRIIGDTPLARSGDGSLKSSIATVFPRHQTLVTTPGVHATQRVVFTRDLNDERSRKGLPPLPPAEELAEWEQSVDLIVENDTILIRPDPERMPLAFEADETLQEIVSKQRIKFLHVTDRQVREAIQRRGEYWRISPLPQSPCQMKQMIQDARVRIKVLPTYYHNHITGTRYLTFHEFAQLGQADPELLRMQLAEIRQFSNSHNHLFCPEIAFFMAGNSFGARDFADFNFLSATPDQLLDAWRELSLRFARAVRPDCHEDNLDNLEWRNRMFAALIGQEDETVSEEILQGLSPEFYMQIGWLPGGRIEEGELIFDPVFDELDRRPGDPELRALCDEKVKPFIFNFIREFENVEYVNIGRVAPSLSRRPNRAGRHELYIAEIKHGDAPKPLARIIGMQKWGIREHLEEGKSLLQAIMEAEEYTDYVLDRRLGCRQLGMNMSERITERRVNERYHGSRREYEGLLIWATYFERDYIPGIATDKIPATRFRNPEYALKFAVLMGRTAVSNIVVGRLNLDGAALFDDGDEVLQEDENGLPLSIVVPDHAGTFSDYETDLLAFAEAYAAPMVRRFPHMSNPAEAVDAYVGELVERFARLQRQYRSRRRAFDTLFTHRKRDVAGSFAYRWERVLDRLNRTDAATLGERIRSFSRLPRASAQAMASSVDAGHSIH